LENGDGATVIEYRFCAARITVAAATAMAALGIKIAPTFNNAAAN